MDFHLTADNRQIYRVSELNNEVRGLLEMNYPQVWVEGEISNLATPASGHRYFSLKDENAQIRCALFRNRRVAGSCKPADGMQVLVRGKVTLYENRGDYQLVIEHIEEAGEGALRRAFEALKNRLAHEGLFDSERKLAIPDTCRRIGVITSPSGAVIRDILTTFRRRFPALSVLVFPVPVQGSEAAPKIVEAIELANERQDCDALILARGGGSLEDLQAFNDESVARAIAHCSIPIVSAVGHEVDFTIADLTADARAATPTAAAELLSPDQRQLISQLIATRRSLYTSLKGELQREAQSVDWLTRRLIHPRQRLASLRQQLDANVKQLQLLQSNKLNELRFVLSNNLAGLRHNSPKSQLAQIKWRHKTASDGLVQQIKHTLSAYTQNHTLLSTRLGSVSPLATLGRGYAIVRDIETDNVLRDANETKQGRRVKADLAQGHLICTVNETCS